MKGKFPTPVNCLSGKFPGVSRGGGWLLQELTHALHLRNCVGNLNADPLHIDYRFTSLYKTF